MMLAMDDILKNRIYLLDGGLKVSHKTIGQLKILSFVPPKSYFQFTTQTRCKVQEKTCLLIQVLDKAHKAVAGVILYSRN